MKKWLGVALIAVVGVSYALFYRLSSMEGQGAASLGLANEVGLFAVFVGLLATAFLLRRAKPAA